ETEETDGIASRRQRGDVVERGLVLEAHHEEEEEGPNEPGGGAGDGGGGEEAHEGGDGDLAVARAEQGVGDAASIELTHGNQVEGGDEEADPRRQRPRVRAHV